MGFWQIDTDTLASGRFVVSPLAETLACLQTLYRGTAAHPAELAWLQAHRPAYQAMVAADPLTGPLLDAALGLRTHWTADLLTTVPLGEAPTFEQEIARTRRTSPEQARADLVVSSGAPLPDAFLHTDLAGRLAEVQEWVWTETVLPTWERRRRVIEADALARTAQLGRDGWAAALNALRPGMRWLGDGRLQINVHDFPPRQTAGARLCFVPVTPARGWVAWDDTPSFAIIYPCSGVLADIDVSALPGPLARLLGPNRALILLLLDAPKSTTQLVALTNQRLGSVGRHLRILFDAGLVRRRRSGKSVLYYRTAAADVLVDSASTPRGGEGGDEERR
ncbi:winged helix-turn-helix domain-containing protein [Catenulispora yoronensis]|uniref:Winged helix-turn-helix domain-containing protein n=1 Tax=Catenulispora yoronensis TaxID=450799 RepID=A0ABP5F6G7_9ACTN